MRAAVVVAGSLAAVLGCGGGTGGTDDALEPERPAPAEVAAAVTARIEATPSVRDTIRSVGDAGADLRILYAGETDQLIWFANSTPRPVLDSLLDALEHADRHGLDPAAYDAEGLRAARRALDSLPRTAERLAALDVGASLGALQYFRALAVGQVVPAAMGFAMQPAREGVDVPALVRAARDAGTLTPVVDSILPVRPGYRRMVKALAAYRELAARGEPATVPNLTASRSKVESGGAWEGIPAVRERLMRLGDLAGDADTGAVYDSVLVGAVERFQARHGLNPDGVIGPATVAAMNVPLAERVEQLEFALERLRWFPALADQRAVVVNLPFYELDAYDHPTGEPVLESRVVIGERGDHATPSFTDSIGYLIFRPYWFIPETIAAQEIVGPALKDSLYLANNQYEVIRRYTDDAEVLEPTPERLDSVARGKLFLRQQPGPLNSLGRVKFMFPNSNDIYLHDTPARSLFGRDRRAFSHGCVRVDRPAELAVWLLADAKKWPRDSVDAAMRAETPRTVGLKRKVPVVLFYVTAMVEGDGTVRFAEDPYGHDARLKAVLGRRS